MNKQYSAIGAKILGLPNTPLCKTKSMQLSILGLLLRVWGLNFCRAFIFSILLILELAGCNLVQILLSLIQVLWHWSFLLGGSIVLANEGGYLVI